MLNETPAGDGYRAQPTASTDRLCTTYNEHGARVSAQPTGRGGVPKREEDKIYPLIPSKIQLECLIGAKLDRLPPMLIRECERNQGPHKARDVRDMLGNAIYDIAGELYEVVKAQRAYTLTWAGDMVERMEPLPDAVQIGDTLAKASIHEARQMMKAVDKPMLRADIFEVRVGILRKKFTSEIWPMITAQCSQRLF